MKTIHDYDLHSRQGLHKSRCLFDITLGMVQHPGPVAIRLAVDRSILPRQGDMRDRTL